MPRNIPNKGMLFAPSRPAIVDARNTTKSYIALYEVIREFNHRNPEFIIELITRDNRGVLNDISVWCETTGNVLISSEVVDEGEMRYLIQKCVLRKSVTPKMITVTISTASLDMVIYPMERAVAGAVSGMEVNIIFEGTGVRLLKKGYRATVAGFIGKFCTDDIEASLKSKMGWPLPRDSMLILEELGAKFWVCGASMEEYGIRGEDLVVKNVNMGGPITWVDLLAKSDVTVATRAEFEKP